MTDDRTKRNVILVVVGIIILLIILFAAGVFDADTSGEFELPAVQVEGGSLPNVDLDAADIDVGTANQTIEVPDIDVSTTNKNVEVPTVSVNSAEAGGE